MMRHTPNYSKPCCCVLKQDKSFRIAAVYAKFVGLSGKEASGADCESFIIG